MPILVLRLRETDGTKARKSESSIEVSKMLGLVCLGYECGPLRKVMDIGSKLEMVCRQVMENTPLSIHGKMQL